MPMWRKGNSTTTVNPLSPCGLEYADKSDKITGDVNRVESFPPFGVQRAVEQSRAVNAGRFDVRLNVQDDDELRRRSS